jgi:hypothetical protein
MVLMASAAHSQTIRFTEIPDGYVGGSIQLPREFGGAMSVSSSDSNALYVSVGGFGDQSIAKVDLRAGEAEIVAAGPFGSIGGLAAIGRIALGPGGAPFAVADLVIVDNATSQTLLLARDGNLDGDYDDEAEVRELIAPILVDGAFGFSGAQARLVPPSAPAGLPPGSIVFQTADNFGQAELLVVVDPLGAPMYRPPGRAFATGFDFNGGFDFDRRGRVIMGTLESAGFTGLVFALDNANGNQVIDLGEATLLVSGENGMADLVLDAEDDAFIAGADENFVAAIRTFRVPEDLADAPVAVETFAPTDAGFLSGLAIASHSLAFEPNAYRGATLIVGGFTADFAAARNLLTLTPVMPLAARSWREYR